ncbi:hypothetical protein SAMN06265784_12020 [Paraburkholderia susongensis]|uniref:Transposase n=1 Tax=Paraburkholderia susongensis TaxID=1515439 RepID=A0A1X7M743_9BURK|nr:hypothetical protein SAMN06265784_12020 [Paraburkholderia susongensis]
MNGGRNSGPLSSTQTVQATQFFGRVQAADCRGDAQAGRVGRAHRSQARHQRQSAVQMASSLSCRRFRHTARRIERDATLPSQKPRHSWRTRPDPFAEVWESEVVPLLCNAPHLMGITVLRKLQDDHLDRYPDSMRRTLERRIRQWRATEGPSQEVFFPPGASARRARTVGLHRHGQAVRDDRRRSV